jgi:hypothetical protein
MNKRIKALAEQAVTESNLPKAYWWITEDCRMEKVAEKFAELIVVNVLSTIDDARFELPDFIVEKVKERFGVK